ncbi:MAG TPA: aminopeptidase P N-terminal domain-containing protein [Haliscomenobacter sp.]|uniref:aminopeptidase P N-terminal domain-containing protein n=1 Tax=Haliscomenobacter sp. TaxID=2717303 RepID=UPI002CA86CEA|nr:aminopeptidase P N-terminal domain-containing protein [Haliscomenobacter sp.]HOY20326.1 aminopeptidase P N-terminal domain-containing protein [Haliscomenobacter sp.]HPH19503.1 aminopeptidase P N-terminal domain-containing protein [Haliscomenobacter sp.]
MKYDPINPEFFTTNRKRFMRKMQPDSLAIFYANDLMPRSGDTFFPFRQNSGLFYLSGLDQEETIVVLFPDCIKEGFQELAFVKRTSDYIAIWEGEKYSKEQARAVSGIQKIYWLDEMPAILHELILLAKRVYINTEEHDRFIPELPTRNMRMARELMERYPGHKYHRSQPILKKLMMNKQPVEVELIQQAIGITGKAFRRVLEFVRPGVMEYEVEAEIAHEFLRNRASGHSYDPIIASGSNSCVLHYTRNNQQCKAGDMLLMDFGAEYAHYASDLTRTIPVSGQFTTRQRSVYESVLRIMRDAQQLLVPGTTLEEYSKEVVKMMESALIDLKLLTRKEIDQQNPELPLYKQYFMHGTSHHLGMDVHDLADRYVPIQEGMVFTCEPGIYIRNENLGIRIENDILVTENGPVDLMASIPVEAEEIEELMSVMISE